MIGGRRAWLTRLGGKRAEQIATLVSELQRRGAGGTAHVLAADDVFDGRTVLLGEAIDQFSDDGGAVLICRPGLALHFPEGGPPLLLVR